MTTAIIDRLRRAVCYVFGCCWAWYEYGDPVLCPSGVEPWRCVLCKRTFREKWRKEGRP